MDRFAMAAALLTAFNLLFAQEISLGRPLEASQPIDSVQVIFDQNDPAFYLGSTERMTEFRQRPGSKVPFNQLAVCTARGDEDHPREVLEPKPRDFKDLKTGYYVVPTSSVVSLNTFGLVINADDPRNTYHDIAYMIPCVWPTDSTRHGDKLLRPWSEGFDSLEYSVDMRIPFAQSQNLYHPNVIDDKANSGFRSDFTAAYVSGCLLLQQVKSLTKNTKAPSFWIAVSFFDLRKHYARETISIDAWSGGTNYPIVMTAAGDKVSPDDGAAFPDAPPDTPMTLRAPVYSLTLPGSESLQAEADPDDPFHHFAFRITRGNLLSAIDRIRERMPDRYGDNGSTPFSTNVSDWELVHFNFDAEVFHRSTLRAPVSPENSRALVVEFKNLRVQQAVRE
jgi:hypothetical protein